MIIDVPLLCAKQLLRVEVLDGNSCRCRKKIHQKTIFFILTKVIYLNQTEIKGVLSQATSNSR